MNQNYAPKTSLTKTLVVYLVALVMLLNPLSAFVAQAQTTFVVRGVVKDPAGKALPGVTVTEKGTANKTTTNERGVYRLRIANADATLSFLYKNVWAEDAVVKSEGRVARTTEARTVYRLDRTIRCATGTVWRAGMGCIQMAGPVYISSGNCPTGKSWGKYTLSGQNGCLPKVEFHMQFDLSVEDAQTLAVKNGWVMATAEEVQNAWKQLELDQFAYGMLNDGRFAVPVQKDHPPNIKRGANIGVTGDNQGFFYVKKAAVSRTQTAPQPAKAQQPKPLDGGEWIPGKSILKDPQCKNEATRGECITELFALADERVFGRRAESLCDSNSGNPMLYGWGTGYKPLLEDAARLLLRKERISATQANIERVQAQLDTDPVRRWQFAPFMLRTMWDALAAPNPSEAQAKFREKFERWVACDETKIAKMTLALWNNHIGKSQSISGRVGERFGPPKPYKNVTFAVLFDTKSGGSIQGFLPLDNPLFIGPKGQKAMTKLYKPMVLYLAPEVDDLQNLRPLGDEMAKLGLIVGKSAGGVGMIAATVGPSLMGASISVGGSTLVPVGSTLARETGKKMLQHMLGLVSKEVGETAAQTSAKAGGKILAKIAPHTSKIVAALAVIAIVATMGEILGKTVADRVKTDQYNASLNKAASTVKDFSVKKYLGAKPSEFKRSALFTQLVKMTIADPADHGFLTLDLPKPNCSRGMKVSGFRCILEVKFHSQASLTLEQAKQVATENGWSLATAKEVKDAWSSLGLDVYAYGRTAEGTFAVPVQKNHSNFRKGSNTGITGGNQGFFYTVGKPMPSVRGYVRIQSASEPTQYLINQDNKPELRRIQPDWQSAQWKLITRGTGQNPPRIIQNRANPKIYLLYRNGQVTFGTSSKNILEFNWQFVDAGSGLAKITTLDNKFLHNRNGKLVLESNPNGDTALWRVQ